jgi:hypothetical protein
MRADVKEEELKEPPSPAPQPSADDSEADSVKGGDEAQVRLNRRELRARAERTRRERARAQARVDKLLPAAVRQVLEANWSYAPATASNASASAEAGAAAAAGGSTAFPGLSGSSAAVVRAHLLCWSSVLEVVAQCNSLKRAVIASYFRELDVCSALLNEVLEHLTVSDEGLWSPNPKAGSEQLSAAIVSGSVWPVMCVPTAPRPGVRVAMHMRRLWNLRRRSAQTHSHHSHHSHAEERCFYAALCSQLFLRTLRLLPALSRFVPLRLSFPCLHLIYLCCVVLLYFVSKNVVVDVHWQHLHYLQTHGEALQPTAHRT